MTDDSTQQAGDELKNGNWRAVTVTPEMATYGAEFWESSALGGA
jgi:hypothetical protein